MSILLFIIILVPLSILIHELGHALIPGLFSNKPVKVVLGNITKLEENKVKFQIGKFHFYFTLSLQGCCYTDLTTLSKSKKILFLLFGPLASLLVSLISFSSLGYIGNSFVREVIVYTANINFIMFLMTIIPITYPKWYLYAGRKSDGLQIIEILKRRDIAA